MLNLIHKIFRHLSKGTLLKRFNDRKKVAAHKEWLRFLKSGNLFIIKHLSSDLKIKLYKDSSLAETLYCYDFEKDEINFLYRFLNKGDVFFDIGANIGLFTIHAAKIVGTSGFVHSFEPAKSTFFRLRENVDLNKFSNVLLNEIAVSDYCGTQDFFVSREGYDAFNSVVMPTKGNDYNVEEVVSITIDEYLSQNNLIEKVKLMKIDVEGWEVPLLKGGRKIFSSNNAPVLIVEFTEQNALNTGFSCPELYQLLIDYGYVLYTYDMNKNLLTKEKLRTSYQSYINVIAVKDVNSFMNIFAIKN